MCQVDDDLCLPKRPSSAVIKRLAAELGVSDDDTTGLLFAFRDRIEAIVVMPLLEFARTVFKAERSTRSWVGWERKVGSLGDTNESQDESHSICYLWWDRSDPDGDFDAELSQLWAGPPGRLLGGLTVEGGHSRWFDWHGYAAGESGAIQTELVAKKNVRIVHLIKTPLPDDAPCDGFATRVATELAIALLTGDCQCWREMERMGVAPSVRKDEAERREELLEWQSRLEEWETSYAKYRLVDQRKASAKLDSAVSNLREKTDELFRNQQEWLRRCRSEHHLDTWCDGSLNERLSEILIGHVLPIPASIRRINSVRLAMLVPRVEFDGEYVQRTLVQRNEDDRIERRDGVSSSVKRLRIGWVALCPTCKRIWHPEKGCPCERPPRIFKRKYWYLIDGECHEVEMRRCLDCEPEEVDGRPLGPLVYASSTQSNCVHCGHCGLSSGTPTRVWIPHRGEDLDMGRRPAHREDGPLASSSWNDAMKQLPEDVAEEREKLINLVEQDASPRKIKEAARELQEKLAKLLNLNQRRRLFVVMLAVLGDDKDRMEQLVRRLLGL